MVPDRHSGWSIWHTSWFYLRGPKQSTTRKCPRRHARGHRSHGHPYQVMANGAGSVGRCKLQSAPAVVHHDAHAANIMTQRAWCWWHNWKKQECTCGDTSWCPVRHTTWFISQGSVAARAPAVISTWCPVRHTTWFNTRCAVVDAA